MRSSRSSRVLVCVSAAASAAALSACGHDAATASSNRGSGSQTEGTTVENAFIVPTFVPGHCALQAGSAASVRFTVTNGRPAGVERLEGISTDAAAMRDLAVTADIPAKSTVGFGQPSAAAVDAGGSRPAVHVDALDPQLQPGMSAMMTFHFSDQGDITMPVPVEACPTQASTP
ncbi:hypothetical protein MJO55_27260 [Mycolicibacterium rufum]|uniref:Copper(I)-binding protein n=1 Tax=Mycolicibacterium rufum TaxID=318424 RepID=A0A9X2YE91_9MYCO|nr:hypothetical protein [Mycolicibacterium rufum]KGI70480.1 hypothetical protein EU78_27135 [Mycolicibacterium rufum]MCV7071690.1 hypothetical protein [Mycolicibacterium rufum]ULP36814.1 hypothetical protein MJO55_27260 [Mycolicibacterium rufum]